MITGHGFLNTLFARFSSHLQPALCYNIMVKRPIIDKEESAL